MPNWKRGRCWHLWGRTDRDESPGRSGTPAAAGPAISVSLVAVHTLTSSNGALPTQTIAPDAPPAIKLEIATSPAVSLLNRPSRISNQGALADASLEGAGPGDEFRIRLVEV
jgi:hypothetical protein